MELVLKSSWDAEPLAIDVFQHKALVVTSQNKAAIWNCITGQQEQQSSFPTEQILSASLHPSGNHVLLGCHDKLILANIAAYEILIFADIKFKCLDCKFNRAGSLFAAIRGQIIEIFDFITGEKISVIECGDTSFCNLQWGNNCRLHAISHDEMRCWDSVNGKMTAEFIVTNGQIIGSAITFEGNAVLALSTNSVSILNHSLEITSEFAIGDSFELTGPIDVSDEGLVFVSIRNQNTKETSIRIISIVNKHQFDTNLGGSTAINMLMVSRDGRFLLIDNAMFTVKDRRGYNQSIITSSDLIEEPLTIKEKSDVLVTSSYVEKQSAILKDAKMRLADLEMLIDLELKTTKDQVISSIREQRKAKVNELTQASSELDALGHEREVTKQQCLQALEEAKAASEQDIRELVRGNKNELMRQVS